MCFNIHNGLKQTCLIIPGLLIIHQAEIDELIVSIAKNPNQGDLIPGTGGLRKLRQSDPRRGKGKRGGLRVIFYWWLGGDQFWLFTVFDKDQADDLTPDQRKALKQMLKLELDQRRPEKR